MSTQAQNLLVDPGFEGIPAPIYGDNLNTSSGAWTFPDSPAANPGDPFALLSIVKMNSTVANLQLAGTMAPNPPTMDADQQAGQDGQAARIYRKLPTGVSSPTHRLGQFFTAPHTGCLRFGVSAYMPSQYGANFLELALHRATSSTVNSFSPTNSYWSQPGLAWVTRNSTVVQGGAGWVEAEHLSAVTAGQRYAFSMMSQFLFLDNAFAEYVDNSNCSGIPAGTPNPPGVGGNVPVLDPAEIDVTKICQPMEPATVGGQVGQLWSCRIEMTVPQAPFAGTLNVTDAFGGSSALSGQIQSITIPSGNGSCTGNECSIPGADFDGSRTEVIEVDLFVSSTAQEPSYMAENCAIAGYDDGAGSTTVLQPACDRTQWIPRAEVVKTCDPLPVGATAPYTLNCQLEVTAENLPTGSYVAVMDAFAARPPQVATVTAPLMTVTSTEAWDCEDVALNTPSSIGLCELSAADMAAAGGSSTLNVQMTFDVDQIPTQVANCRFIDISQGSALGAMGLRSAQMGGSGNGWPQMPDGCVFIDVPGVPLTPKVEARMVKRCDTPVPHVHNGVQGYRWPCRAEIEVTPSPFAGTFTFDDDGSNISIGTAEFLNASDPGCTGIGSGQLTCTLQGATMTLPHVVSYDLFTALTDPDQPIEWQNCIKGEADTSAGQFPTVPMCVGVTIKPDITLVDPVKEITVEKSCGRPHQTVHDGQQGVGWNCEITVTASPVPFAGTFSFDEDASAIAGAQGQIVGIVQPGNDWTCQPGVPTQATTCAIAGTDFDPSGVETVGVELFAPTGGEPIKWTNCVSGTYQPPNGEPREVGGNCVDMTWDDVKTPPTFSLKKNCHGPTAFGDAQRYLCTISVTQTGGDPITQPLTLEELFRTAPAGPLATQWMIALSGSAGWVCDMPTASCSIQPGDFNGVSGHQVSGIFLIPNDALAEQDFENCAALNMGDEQVATAPCVDMDEPDVDADLSVTKTCKRNGEPQAFSQNNQIQPWRCTLTVTNAGGAYGGVIWLSEELSFGSYPGGTMITNVSSTDPWQCVPGPYGGTGQPAQPSCALAAGQFPASGSSSLTVDLLVPSATANVTGAENCVSIFGGDESGPVQPALSQSCFELVPPPAEPTLSIEKTCAPAVRGAGGQWQVACQVTVTGTGLPAGHTFRISDELTGQGATQANGGQFTPGPHVAQNCGGAGMQNGVFAGCDLLTDHLTAAGGSITLDYSGTLATGGSLVNPPARNCAFVDIPSLGLHAPGGPGDKTCVDIPLIAQAVPGGDVGVLNPLPSLPGGPVGPAVPGTGVAVPDLPQIPTPTPMPEPQVEVTKTCAPLVFAAGAPSATARCEIRIVAQGLPAGGTYVINDTLRNHGASVASGLNRVPLAGTFMNLGPAVPGWSCRDAWQVSSGQCQGSTDAFMANGGTRVFQWSAEVLRPADGEVPRYENCVAFSWNGGSHGLERNCTPIPARVIGGGQAGAPAPTPTPAPSPVPPSLPPQFEVTKELLGNCRVQRSSQLYECLFRVTVTNAGSTPWSGALALSDQLSGPGVRGMEVTRANGWACSRLRGGAFSCLSGNLNLSPRQATHFDVAMAIKGVRGGGTARNCAVLGIGTDQAARVRVAQMAMNARGLSAGTVDGIPGPRTNRALERLRAQLGLPPGGGFDNALFAALGVPLDAPTAQSCVTVPLAPMPAPPLACDSGTTVTDGEACACRYPNMVRRNATSCACARGFDLIAGAGCIRRPTPDPIPVPEPIPLPIPEPLPVPIPEPLPIPVPIPVPIPEPVPAPEPADLACEKASTVKRGGACVCIDPVNARKVSETQCRCKNGGPMVGGVCLNIAIPVPGAGGGDGPAGTGDEACRLRINGICVKR